MSTKPEAPPRSSAAWSHGDDAGVHTPGGPARYARGGELGRGGMGVVEAAVDTWLGRDVAVKRPRADRAADTARLAREARITARLVHPGIPPVYDVGEDAQGPYYTMPVLVGTTLHDRLRTPAPLRETVAAVATAARIAGYAHARGVVHRDLKPANILLGEHGEVWVLDWGVALDPADRDAARVGTVGYQAPEATAGQVVTPAADVFSLGRTLHEVLDAHAEAAPELRAVVARATHADPAARYAHGAALAAELERWLGGRMVEAHAYPVSEVLTHFVRRWRAPLALAGLAAVIGVVLGISALRAQRAARARADRSLAVSLAQRAEALRQRDAHPEAEVLAAHALELAESPLARGVLMASSSSSSSLSLHDQRPAPCPHPFVEPDGYAICAGEELRLVGPDGQLRWVAAFAVEQPAVGEVVEARRYDGDVVVVRRSSNHVEVWRAGTRGRTFAHQGYLGLADGPVAALFDQRRVGLLELETGAVRWGIETCERIETAFVAEDGVVVACREPELYVGRFDALGAARRVTGHPSVVAWQDGPLAGTFEGQVLAWEGDTLRSIDTGVGAVRQLLPLTGGDVVVVGEHREVRVWSPRERVLVAALPRGSIAVAVDGSARLLAFGARVARYDLPRALRPLAHDRRDGGGISAFELSPSGDWLVAGHATGEITSWHVDTGASHVEAPPSDAAAKALLVVDDHAFIYARGAEGVVRQGRGGGEVAVVSRAVARSAHRFGAGIALLPWSPRVVLVDEHERSVPLPARPMAAATAADGELWIADERGGVHAFTDGAAAHRFDLPVPTAVMAASRDLLIFGEGTAIVARDHRGAERWRHDGIATVTALAASATWIAAGDLDGRVLLVRRDGVLVAGIAGHARRVSGLAFRGDQLISSGWDGLLRVWNLADVDAPPRALVGRVTARWGLTLDEALAIADPLGAWHVSR